MKRIDVTEQLLKLVDFDRKGSFEALAHAFLVLSFLLSEVKCLANGAVRNSPMPHIAAFRVRSEVPETTRAKTLDSW